MNLSFRILLGQFEEYLEARNFSKRTSKEYPLSVAKFLEFIEEDRVFDIGRITREHIQGYHYSLLEKVYCGKPLSQSTLNKRLTEVKSFFRFLYKMEKIYIDPSQHYEVPKRAKLLPRNILDVWEVEKLLKGPDLNTLLGIRDRAILELLYSTGIRSSELRCLRLSKLFLRDRQIQIIGKGNKEALVPFGLRCAEAIENYLLFSRSKLLKQYKGGPKYRGKVLGEELVFVSVNGNQVTGDNLTMLVKKYGEKVGLEKKITPHGLRHSCATHLLKNGADIRLIQKLLRHEDLNTTQIYTRVDIGDLKEAQKKYHPREIKE